MSALIGLVLALSSVALARTARFDRRTFYALVLIISATYYILFAVMAGSVRATIIESLIMTTFVMFAAVGFRVNPWLIVAGFAAHGTLDLVHTLLITNPGVPAWWPPFCMAYDVGAAGVFGVSIVRTPSTRTRS